LNYLARPKRFELLSPRFVSGALSANLGVPCDTRFVNCPRSAADPIETQQGFAALLDRIEK